LDAIKYKTSSPAGDCISFMAGIKKIWEQTGRKGVVYQLLNVVGSALGEMRPFLDGNGDGVCMDRRMFELLSPLIKAQPYIEDFLEYNGEKVDFDFDLVRQERFVNQPKGSLHRWFNYIFPEMASDLSKPWLEWDTNISKDTFFKDKVVINFTNRYRNNFVNYFFLKEYQDKIYFAGLESECDFFNKRWGLSIQHLVDKDFKDFAETISSCKFFMGNQSVCYHIAEALKVPRILELCPILPNVIPVGENAFDFYIQGAVEIYFKKMIQ